MRRKPPNEKLMQVEMSEAKLRMIPTIPTLVSLRIGVDAMLK